jgi:hypothetical protein
MGAANLARRDPSPGCDGAPRALIVVGRMRRERITGVGVRARRDAAVAGARAPAVGGPAGRLLALQRTAGNAAVGALLRAEAAAPRRIEERAAAPDRRMLQRLTITQHSFEAGECGARNVQWVFSLDAPAPMDGYIVQHVRFQEGIAKCPAKAKPPKLTDEFWEAWLVKKGDKVDSTTTRDGWTDGSRRLPYPGTNGTQTSEGIVKFFGKDVTGDLGDFDKAPADTTSEWGPGKVPTSGALPSTPKQPKWWTTTPIEGPANRVATSVWDCCDPDPKKHTSTVTAKPAP